MKHTLIYWFSIGAALLLMGGCAKEKPSQEEILAGRERVDISVSYTSGGAAVSALNFTHDAVSYTLDVNVNSENLLWTLESSAPWCHVVEGEHKGSGQVVLEVDVNESFEDRDAATLTFVAGDFRGFSIPVRQSATAFIVSQPYFVAPLRGGSYTTRVVTAKGIQWDWVSDEWLTVSKASTTSTDEFDITELAISVGMDMDVSRYGTVTLRSGNDKAEIALWQFGTEIGYDRSGNIFFGNDERAMLRFTTPGYCVKDVLVPDYAQSEIRHNDDGTDTVIITLQDNLSDCAENREAGISLVMSNLSGAIVNLPAVMQEYAPAGGLMTGRGMEVFAQAVADGTPTTDWERNGVVTVLQDINMADVVGWKGIGTAEKPYTGSFNGGGFSLTNLTGTGAGIFNYCQDATISDIRLGKGCSIYQSDAYVGKAYFGGIVSHAVNTLISGCSLGGALEFSGHTSDEAEAYVGGIVGWADASSRISACRMIDQGSLMVTSPDATNVVFYLGGIAGLCEGELSLSEMSGELKFSASGTALMGGAESVLIPEASVKDNAFNGKLVLGGTASQGVVGGLYGTAQSDRSFDAATDKSVSMGSIQVDSYAADEATTVFAGGFMGKAQGETSLSFKGYEMKTSFKLDQTQPRQVRYMCVGGVLGGCDPSLEAASLLFESISNSGAVSILYSATGAYMRHALFGGIAGFVNGPARVVSCTNSGAIGVADSKGNPRCGASSNDYCEIIGGIVGCADGGDLELTSCINAAAITNLHYTNRPSTAVFDGMYCAQVAGGLLGAFQYVENPENYTLTIKDCINSEKGQVLSFRGYSGGVVGFCRNATIEGSSSSGGQAASSNDNAYYRGGIAGSILSGTIRNCWATGSITSGAGGSAEAAFSGGIAGWIKGSDPVRLESCRFSGRINSTKSGEKPIYPGGIVGAASAATEVVNCQYGGSVQGTDITANNASTPKLAVGNIDEVSCTVSGLGYWDGKTQ